MGLSQFNRWLEIDSLDVISMLENLNSRTQTFGERAYLIAINYIKTTLYKNRTILKKKLIDKPNDIKTHNIPYSHYIVVLLSSHRMS